MRFKELLTAFTATTALESSLVACSSNDAHDPPAETAVSTMPSSNPDRIVKNPTTLSAEQFCSILSKADTRPLTDGKVTAAPTHTTDRGLPGCKWPVQDAYGWLEMKVFKPYNVEILLEATTDAAIPVSTGRLYVQIETSSTCRAFFKSPETPDGFVLSVALGTPLGVGNPELCKSTVPQITKVAKAVGW